MVLIFRPLSTLLTTLFFPSSSEKRVQNWMLLSYSGGTTFSLLLSFYPLSLFLLYFHILNRGFIFSWTSITITCLFKYKICPLTYNCIHFFGSHIPQLAYLKHIYPQKWMNEKTHILIVPLSQASFHHCCGKFGKEMKNKSYTPEY